jgi:hypothetical protein
MHELRRLEASPSNHPAIHSAFSYTGRPVELVDSIIDEYGAESARLGAHNGGVGPPEHSPVRPASGMSPLLGWQCIRSARLGSSAP